MPPEIASRVAVSIAVFLGWLIFLVTFLAFYAGNFGTYQSLAIILVSIFIGVAILAPMWAHWGMKYGGRYAKEWRPRPRGRSMLKRVVFLCWLVFLVLFLGFYASNFNIYQNLAIIIVSLLVYLAITMPMRFREFRHGWRQPGELERPARRPRRRKK
jgi:MFS family permease